MESYGPEEITYGADNSSHRARNENDCSIQTIVERWRSSCRVLLTLGGTPNDDVPEEGNPVDGRRPQLASGQGHTKKRSEWKVLTLHGHKPGWGRPLPMV